MVRRAHIKRQWCCYALAVALHSLAGGGNALANSGKDAPAATKQQPAQQIIRYKVIVELTAEPPELRASLTRISRLAALAPQGAGDIGALATRARADLKLLKAGLFDAGYYGGTISIRIAGHDVSAGLPEGFVGAGSNVMPVVINVVPGPVFRFGKIELTTNQATPVSPPMTPADYLLIPGKKARASIIVAAIDQIVEEWRGAGYPFARVAERKISADHRTHKLDVRIVIDPGRSATYGWLSVAGSKAVSSQMLSRYSGLKSGQTYNPEDLRKAGDRLRKLDAIDSVRISHGEGLDESGGVPITFTVTERKSRFIGAAASMSTADGGEVKAYWGHRNLFGRAERLKVEGAVSQIGNDELRDMQYLGQATLTVPGILDIDTDLVTEFRAAKERPDTYESNSVRFKVGLNRRMSETLSGSAAVAATGTRDEDAFGTATHRLVSLPTGIVNDTRDSKLEPIRGWRASLTAEPAHDFFNGSTFLIGRGQLSGYQRLDGNGRIVLAARAGVAGIAGAETSAIPASMRLYGGGSGSVRGYAYQSLGPIINGRVVGGRGLAEGSVELRWRVSESIGLVGFVDAAAVSADNIPMGADLKIGTGLGLRYYTSLGPIRLDLAVPADGNDKLRFSDVAFYVGLGQAF